MRVKKSFLAVLDDEVTRPPVSVRSLKDFSAICLGTGPCDARWGGPVDLNVRGMQGMTPKRIAFLVLGVLVATFFIQNAEAVPVRFLFWTTTVSRSIVLLITFAFGLIVGLLSGRVGRKDGSSLLSNLKD